MKILNKKQTDLLLKTLNQKHNECLEYMNKLDPKTDLDQIEECVKILKKIDDKIYENM